MSIIANQLSYYHPNKEMLFQNISFSLGDDEKAALIGNNGSGKSTLLKIIAGLIDNYEGDIIRSEKIYYIPQNIEMYNDRTVAQALDIDKKTAALNAILNGNTDEKYFLELNDDWLIEEKASLALNNWNLNHISLSDTLNTLSGGEKMKVFLSGISIHQPQIIIMDEPTNHLDLASREQLYKFVASSKISMLIVSHDRNLLNLLPIIYEIDQSKIHRYGGNYEFYKLQKTEKINALQEQLSEKEKALRKAKTIAREENQRQQKKAVRGEKSNLKKGLPKILMGNLKNKSEKNSAKLKEIHSEKTEKILNDLKEIQNQISELKELKINLENTELHKGKILFDAKELNFKYSNDYLWNKNLNFQIRSGERWHIRGKNGSGKSTLLKLILGLKKASTGKALNTAFNYLYIDQEYSLIDNQLTVFEQAGKFNSRHFLEHDIKMYLHRFLFGVEMWDKKCEGLSGGEKIRLIFCCLQLSNNMPDVFVLDEPTNNLDIQSMEIVSSVIKSYKGSLIVISHDAYFLNEIGIDKCLEL